MDGDQVAPLVLTEHEKRLFELLMGAQKHYGLGTILRVAGGWVRDKIMGRDSHDIDIALDNMSGNAFANKVNDYLAHLGLETHHIGVIQSNPDQSKHLETATVKVLGSWIDFVNLRSEAYTEHSRIPSKIEIGTPEQDANRRDLTINALFYNINTGLVEDFTKRGMEHIRSKIICTPLPPLQTFMDDPLRVLRAFRFASRLPGFSINPELLEAASSPQVVEALAKKIARERIGKELDGMMLATRPELAINWIQMNGLFPVVFMPPTTLNQTLDLEQAALDATTLVRRMICVSRSISLEWTHEDRRLAVLAASLLPFADCTYTTPKRRIDSVANFVVLESLKHPKVDADQVILLHFGVKQFERLFQPDHLLAPGEPGIQNIPLTEQKVALGRVMRKVGTLWHTALLLATLDHLPHFPSPLTVEDFDAPLPLSHPILATYISIRQQIETLGMDSAHEMKPFFSGDDLQALLSIGPGPLLGTTLERQIDWMLQHYDQVRSTPDLAKQNCQTFLTSPEFKATLDAATNQTRSKGAKQKQ
jgi:tRNA nucleotidyltransferase/poly(A) polymerase